MSDNPQYVHIPSTGWVRTMVGYAKMKAEYRTKTAYEACQQGYKWFDRWLANERAEAWDEGHVAYQRREGDDGCSCGAWSEGECACGLYGTGTLLSVKDNPYRVTR